MSDSFLEPGDARLVDTLAVHDIALTNLILGQAQVPGSHVLACLAHVASPAVRIYCVITTVIISI